MEARNAAAVALTIIAYALRICAIALCLIVIILCFSGLVARLGLMGLVIDLSRALPQSIAGWGVIATPFGGVFRLDFAIIAALMFIFDFACVRAARQIR